MQRANIRRRGFTITEVTVCMIIIAVLSFLSLSPRIAEQTGRAEAERLYTWLTRMTQKASRMRRGFTINITANVEVDEIKVSWSGSSTASNNDKFTATPGCKFKYNNHNNKISFNASDNGFGITNGHFTVKGNGKDKESDKYYVILSKTGRIRTSDTEPSASE